MAQEKFVGDGGPLASEAKQRMKEPSTPKAKTVGQDYAKRVMGKFQQSNAPKRKSGTKRQRALK